MIDKAKIFIIILNWNRAEDTIDCLESVKKLSNLNHELTILVVDNASTDGSQERIKKSDSKLILLENTENLGFAGGNNVGIKYAINNGADFVIILNNDTRVDKDLVDQLITPALKDRTIGLVSPKIYFEEGFEFHKDRYKEEDGGKVIWYAGGLIDWGNVYGSTKGVDEVDRGQYDKMEKTDFATGTCMLISRGLLETVGMFDEKYFMYYDDTDFSLRAKKAGFKVVYNPNGTVWHKVSQSSGIGSELGDYYTTRNRMLFGLKYATLPTKFALLRESIKLLLVGRKWQKIGIKDFYLGNFGKGSWE